MPAAKLQPKVQIYIHLNTVNNTAGVVGDVGEAASIAEHQYRPSKRLKETVHLTFPSEAFPFSNKNSRGLDLDHTLAYQSSSRDPQTKLGNFEPLNRRTHRAKTAGFWTCQQPVTGQTTWTSPLGFRYTVDKDGTHSQE